MASTCHEWTGWRPLRCRQSQKLLLVLAKAGGDKGWCLRTARTDLLGGVGTSSVRRPPYDHRKQRWAAVLQPTTQAPHFLAMMVRAPRAVDLLAKFGAFGPGPALAGFPAWRPPMSLSLQPLPSVPDDTARIARAAFRRGNPYVLLRDKIGAVFADADFADLYPKLGQPAYAPWRLALVTLMQFREGLSDRQAADAAPSTC